MKKALLSVLVLVGSALPASATTITIDSSTGCTNCYGLSWQLTINSAGGYVFSGTTYGYQAILNVTDDPALAGTPSSSLVISAVDYKVSNSAQTAVLYSFPTTSSNWTTQVNVLNSNGCTGPSAGFVCSQTATDPANFTTSVPALSWGWYFNTTDPIFAGLYGSHIGAKLTTLSTKGHLLSETYTFQQVPEPQAVMFLGLGIVMFLAASRRSSFGLL